ncbi:MAG TPA: hypothetical protein VNU44_23705 [Bryobacteraceae bacterium]|jgi:hypothetical protein|nr:hypothetical protein [Bryobacteraceae bacterium]
MAFTMQSLTPILLVDAIEPCLNFWMRLGFEVTVQVPDGDTIGFVILKNGPVEVMYQTRASVAKDVPSMTEFPSSSILYIHVTNLDEIIAAVAGAPVLIPKRTTFYGATEYAVREPGGSAVSFSETSANAG